MGQHHMDLKKLLQRLQMIAQRQRARPIQRCRESVVLKTFFICLLSLCGIDFASACVSIQRSGRQHLIMNNCQYPVIVHYVSSSGATGTTESIPPGGLDLTPIPIRYGLQLNWCNYTAWKAGTCKLPKG